LKQEGQKIPNNFHKWKKI